MLETATGTFRDPALPVADRVTDLVSRLTLDEKIGLLHQYQAPVERLGVAAFRTGTEALHGLAWLGPATVFPQAVGLASTWDPDLVRRVGAATADEVLAFHHKDPSGAGRNVWAPVTNPLRDPRWGRNEEGYAEDPWLTGVLATAYARGLRGDDPHRMKTAPTLKHFLAYNNETQRCTSSSHLPQRVLHEYELRAHLPALAAGAAVAVMPSYNLVNGRPAHLTPLINAALRPAAGDDILVVSDAYAPGNIATPDQQAFHPDHPHAYAHALRAGLDSFTQDDEYPDTTLDHLRTALRAGLLTETDVDTAVRHILSVRTRLGEFDPQPPHTEVTEDVVNCPAHQDLAREAARRSVVLLKNNGLLPLAAPLRVAVIGQLADTLHEDWYSGTLPYAVTVRSGIAERADVTFGEGVNRVALRAAAGYVTAGTGTTGGQLGVTPARDSTVLGDAAHFDVFDWGGGACALRAAANRRFLTAGEDRMLVNDQPGPNGWEVRQTFRLQDRPDGKVALLHIATGRYVCVDGRGRLGLTDDGDAAMAITVEVVRDGAAEAASLASAADVAVVVAGDHPLVNGRETEDRRDLELPAAQDVVLRAVAAANPATVLVLTSGYPFAVRWAAENVPAILWSSHGGQEYGHGLADVLFGDVDPTGRLTQTWYRSAAELPDLFDYDIIATDATYLYYLGDPLYPFGHGLSYTTFDYADPEVEVRGERVVVGVTVRNTGRRAGEEVVQCYTHQRFSRVKQPRRQLRGFTRVTLEPGEWRRVTITFDVAALAVWDVTRGRFVVEDAPRKIQLARSAKEVLACAPLAVPGETIPPRDPFAGPWDACAHDDYYGVELCPTTPEDGESVRSVEAASWLAFLDTDFGAGAGECRVVANMVPSSPESVGPGTVALRLDDPLSGPVVGTATVAPRADRYAATEVVAPLTGATGRRDLFLTFDQPGVIVTSLRFARARP